MYQVKIFEGCSNEEQAVNDWLKENTNVEVKSVSVHHMIDMYQGMAPQVCNQWYSTIVVYVEKGERPCPKIETSCTSK